MEKPEAGKQVAPPKYKGARMRKWGRWVAEVRYPNSRKRLWLGSFPTAEMAARAYDAAVYCLRGPGEGLNFPEMPPNIPSADKLSRYEIREAALRHAREGARRPEGEAEAQEEGGGAKVVDPGEGSSGLDTSTGEQVEELFSDFHDAGQDVDLWGGNDGGGDDDGDVFGTFPLWTF